MVFHSVVKYSFLQKGMQHNLLSFANNTSVRLDQMFTFSYVKHFYSMGPNFIRRGGLCWQGYSYQRYMLPRVPVFMMGTHLYTEPLSLVPLHLPRLDFFDGSKGPFTVLIHLLLNRTEYYQLQIVSKILTKMHTHLCIDIRVVLLFVNRTGKLVEMSADEKSWWWLKISSSVDAEKFF